MRVFLPYLSWLAVAMVLPFWLSDNPVIAAILAALAAAALLVVGGLHLMGESLKRLLSPHR